MLLLFDIDGVLNQSDYFTVQYEKDVGVKREVFDRFFKDELPDLLIGKERIEDVLTIYFETWEWKGTTDEFLEYWFEHDVKFDRELLKIIQELKEKGIKIGIASQQEFRRKKYLLNHNNLSEIIDFSYFSCDLGYLKTEPEFYQYILSQHHEKIYFWDDTQENVDIANLAGIHSYLYDTIDKFKIQLVEILKKM
jgi:putative hydrolase of the HAD superfamily